jgi:hypothetical protein
VLWTEFETEVETIRTALAAVPDEVPMMDAIRGAVVAANALPGQGCSGDAAADEPDRHHAGAGPG